MLLLNSRLTKNQRRASRARLFYLAVSVAFLALAVVGAATGNIAVAVIAAVVAVVTMVVALLVPKLTRPMRETANLRSQHGNDTRG